MKLIAIETSCDETAAAVVEGGGINKPVKILSSVVVSSLDLHQKTGGIVPEVAAREQLSSMVPVLDKSLEESGVSLSELDGVAITVGPGLVGSLLVGVETAKSLAKSLNKPLYEVNHLTAHLFSNWIERTDNFPKFPALGMVVSGGHTDILYFESEKNYEWIGGTRDDAAGECFDKCARILLNAPYPGGPAIAKAASLAKNTDNKFLPRPMINHGGLEMSFSGLKTALKNKLKDEPDFDKNLLALDLQRSIVEVLISKLVGAVDKYKVESILLGGGVLANNYFRQQLGLLEKSLGIPILVPDIKYCSDNAVMVGAEVLVTGKESSLVDYVFADPGLEF